ncbi:hypothetical protein MN116_002388 [Schistosoma mekongi]|uniref:TAFH domain-containing protein n=1 Tax=Schistosoma mekongi TaxID=38744 RepID=A0AAE1ZJY6_SCHME|nr:hypothetical protein MN116_002388 [Schistosoma mekongi]
MGDRPAGQHQVPVPVRIPLSSIRGQSRPLGNIVPANVPRSSLVNQVYLLPKSGLTNNVLPNAPSVMQVRSLAVGQTVLQPNGVIATTPVIPRVVTPQSGSSTKLVGFFNQLLELSKNVSASTHSSVATLIQALVNGELDASSFSAQLRSNLKSANPGMDLAPFIKDNIDLLRRDLANGVCRLPNIQPPKDIFASVPAAVPVSIVTTLPTLGLQARPNAAISTALVSSAPPAGPRVTLSTSTTPRIVGTLMSSVSSPVIPTSPVTVPTPRTQPPLLAPAPPRTCLASVVNFDTNLSPSPGAKYRLAQSFSGVSSSTTILSNATAATVVPTRFTPTVNATRPNYHNLRPIIASSSASAALGINLASIKSAAGVSATVSPLIRAKTGYTNNYSPGILPAVHNKVGSNLLSLGGSTVLIEGADRKQNDLTLMNDDIRHTTMSPTRDSPFFPSEKVKEILETHGIKTLTEESIVCLAHGLQIFIKNLLAKLRIVVSHRLYRLSEDSRLVQTDHTREQLRFLQKLDEHDRIRQSELEKDLILKAAKSRSRNEDPHQMQMREMARRIASEDYEREKQHQANLTALHAIGPQRKRRLDTLDEMGNPIPTDLLGASFPARDSVTNLLGTLPTASRLSIVSANRLGLVTSGSNVTQLNLEASPANSNSLISGANGTSDNVPNAPGFSLSLSLRAHRATLRDIQVILSRTPRLRRTRTYYRTYWRTQP